jgi:hypothetical protein
MEAVVDVASRCIEHAAGLRTVVGGVLERAKVMRSRQVGLLRECSDAVNAAADAAHGRLGKLLNAR